MEHILQVAKKDSPTVASLFICDTNGQQVARDSGNYVNVADRDYIKAVLQQGKQYAFSDATISKATNKVMIIAAVPIKDEQGTIIGAMASTFNMDTLQTLLNENTNILNDRKEVIYLTDSKGNVMIHPEQKFIETITNWNTMAPVKSAADGKSIAMEYINADGTDCLAASAPVGSMGWGLVVENNRSEVMDVLYSAIMQVAAVVLILLLGVFVFARVLAGTFVRPMKELERKTGMMADGDLTVHLEGDAISELACCNHKRDLPKFIYLSQTFYSICRCFASTISVEARHFYRMISFLGALVITSQPFSRRIITSSMRTPKRPGR